MVFWTGKSGIEDAISPSEFEVNAVEVCADGMEPLATTHSTGGFHACLFQAESA